MAILGSIYHDFPRLAKQSGFYFQLHKGRVNWTELENLNLNEIIQNRNFQLLERNLVNVLNCDLEREYDLKILDHNFVKLFKLAQLGVDYLAYCEMYLDRCVVLLQERLTAFQQDYECLKKENEKKKEELSRTKRKNKAESFQCQKCEKVFISEVYLKFHDKRRHSDSVTPQSLGGLQKQAVTDNYQQTETSRTLSTSTQTLFFDEGATYTQETEESVCVKKHHILKMEELERELQEFKERLKKAETSLLEKNETSKSSPPFHVPGSMYCNSMLMFLPPYLKQSNNGFYEINPECPISLPVPEIPQRMNSLSPAVISEKSDSKPAAENISPKENSCLLNTESEKISESEGEPTGDVQKSSSFQNYHEEEKEDSKHNKENLDPNIKKNNFSNLNPPLPPPRKLKKEFSAPIFLEEKHFEAVAEVKKAGQTEGETGFSSHSVINTSTPLKEKQEGIVEIPEKSEENLGETSKSESILNEDVKTGKAILHDQTTESVIKKIIKRNSPKLQTFSKSLKRSLTNLYDSVSTSERDLKCKESNDKSLRSSVLEGLNNRLKQLGVDPEWSGIPKKTMNQKLSALKHRRRLLSKENPTYPALRQAIEEKIFKKLKKNFTGKKSSSTPKLNKALTGTGSPEALNGQDDLPNDKQEFVKVKNCLMYDIDTDSESKTSESEGNFNEGKKQTVEVEEFVDEAEPKVEFDLSVFQVGGGISDKGENRKKSMSVSKEDELITVSDSEDSLSENSADKTFMTLTSFLGHKSRGDNNNQMDNSDNVEQSGKPNSENQSILKEGGFHSVPTTSKKKVLFANYSNIIDEELSDSPLDDDLWSLKTDWEKDTS